MAAPSSADVAPMGLRPDYGIESATNMPLLRSYFRAKISGRPVAPVLNSRGVLFRPFLLEDPTDRMTPIQFNPVVANWSDPPVSPIRQVEFAGHP